jgi:hypothetical protein
MELFYYVFQNFWETLCFCLRRLSGCPDVRIKLVHPSLLKMATRAKHRKILSGLQKSNYWWDFNQTLQE